HPAERGVPSRELRGNGTLPARPRPDEPVQSKVPGRATGEHAIRDQVMGYGHSFALQDRVGVLQEIPVTIIEGDTAEPAQRLPVGMALEQLGKRYDAKVPLQEADLSLERCRRHGRVTRVRLRRDAVV